MNHNRQQRARMLQARPLSECRARADAGFYLSGELGPYVTRGIELRSGDDDRPSRCDEFANPRYAEPDGCTAADRGDGAVDDWKIGFDNT